MLDCPLCSMPSTELWYTDNQREYFRCENCQMVHVPVVYHLSARKEKAEYDKHQNVITDYGYRQFLSRLFKPLSKKLSPGMSGLDFGCGPGPALQNLFQEAGFEMALYDIYYQPEQSVLSRQYHFITMTEVVEHLSQPAAILNMLWKQLLPGGYMGVMTKLVIDKEAFASWHYKNDPTHISFFSEDTMQYLAQQLGARLEFVADDAIIFHKPVRR